ncbi:Uncharacterised protein [uncultured Leptotrichia sp.]|jgi:hypothetical protein|uniref:hypothetical protein n=1 Tax=uncultured Leptotrichia sp. TaxID=159271 RepID=UPI001A3FE380|nr:hypothetical protein [uncultured Leptotrichia sp.]VTX54926.1 Uncharacterised protein [uncultured Leptotrichia sp.]
MKLKELFPNQDIENMELKKLIEMISYKDFNTLLERTENKKDIDFYIELQDLVMRRKQKEAIEKGIY